MRLSTVIGLTGTVIVTSKGITGRRVTTVDVRLTGFNMSRGTTGSVVKTTSTVRCNRTITIITTVGLRRGGCMANCLTFVVTTSNRVTTARMDV